MRKGRVNVKISITEDIGLRLAYAEGTVELVSIVIPNHVFITVRASHCLDTVKQCFIKLVMELGTVLTGDTDKLLLELQSSLESSGGAPSEGAVLMPTRICSSTVSHVATWRWLYCEEETYFKLTMDGELIITTTRRRVKYVCTFNSSQLSWLIRNKALSTVKRMMVKVIYGLVEGKPMTEVAVELPGLFGSSYTTEEVGPVLPPFEYSKGSEFKHKPTWEWLYERL